MDDITRKRRASKSKNLLNDYEDLLHEVIEEERVKQQKDTKIGTSMFEIARDDISKKSRLEGMKQMITKLYEYAKEG